MLDNPPPLADQFASLRATTATAQPPLWLPASLHALILAALASLFSCLEDLIRLWQSGNLPTPQPRPEPTPRPAPGSRRAPTTPPLRTASSHPRAHPAETRPPTRDVVANPRAVRIGRAPNRATQIIQLRATIPPLRPRSAHDPPPLHCPICRDNRRFAVAKPCQL